VRKALKLCSAQIAGRGEESQTRSRGATTEEPLEVRKALEVELPFLRPMEVSVDGGLDQVEGAIRHLHYLLPGGRMLAEAVERAADVPQELAVEEDRASFGLKRALCRGGDGKHFKCV
jgi:hypothetical protein